MNLLLSTIFVLNTVQLFGGIIMLQHSGSGLNVNYWSIGNGNQSNDPLPASQFHNMQGVFLPVEQSATSFTKPQIACGNGYLGAMTNFSLNSDADSISDNDCTQLRKRALIYSNTSRDRWAYDSLRYYIEHCFYQSDVIYTFSSISGSCGTLSSTEDFLWPHYQNWLLDVLYLREDSLYYCADAIELSRTATFIDSGRSDFRAGISVLRYLKDSVDCGPLNITVEHMLEDWDFAIHIAWRDTVKDSASAAPPDTTTIRTLDELGLQALRQIHSNVDDDAYLSNGLLTNIRINPNPVNNIVNFQFNLSAPAVLKLELLNELGKSVFTKPLGWKPTGEDNVSADIGNLAPGVYYVRISSLRGDRITLKLIKQ